jgi:hypothetical protein
MTLLRHMPAVLALRIVAWCGLFLLAVFMLIPGAGRPQVLSSGLIEHFLAFGLISFALSCGCWHLRHPWIAPTGLTGYAGALEALQGLVPGRDAKLIDFMMSTSGIWAAFGACLVAMPLLKRLMSRKPENDSVADLTKDRHQTFRQ